jgi:nucleoside-diphosphate-sugar epimerase
MRLLVLGGTVFLGRAVARHAVDAGHDVTCAARGISGAVPKGARLVRVDRDRPGDLSTLEGQQFDAVVDVPDVPATCAARWRSSAGRGLIAGPEDPSGRFDYWVARLARGGEVLAPGRPNDQVQWVDVRDLAAWLVLAGETGLTGTYDGIGAPVPRSQFLARIAEGVGATPRLTWVDQDFLAEHGVQPWMGERSLPMWLPLPDYAGFMTRDVSPALLTGLRTRPLIDTARDTLGWLRTRPDRTLRVGLDPGDEASVLCTWHDRTS